MFLEKLRKRSTIYEIVSHSWKRSVSRGWSPVTLTGVRRLLQLVAGRLYQLVLHATVSRGWSPVTVSSVRAAYRVDFLATYGSRLARFKKDYFAMVSPKDLGMPAWDTMRARLFSEFAAEGARWVDGGEVELPDVVWREFADTAASGLGRHY